MRPKTNHTLRIPFKPRASAAAFHTIRAWEERGVKLLSGCALFLVAAYIALVGASIMNVMDRTSAEERYSKLKGNVSALETEYYELSKRASVAHASELDLAPLTSRTFIAAPGTAVGLAPTQGNEI